MTDQPAAEIVETPEIPGNPVQTARAVETFVNKPEILAYINTEVEKRIGKPGTPQTQTPTPPADSVSAAEFEALRMALKYNIPEDKLALIQDTTPEGVRVRAEQLAALLPKPSAAAPAPELQAPPETPKAAGVPLPAIKAEDLKFAPGQERDVLRQYFAANPLPPIK